MNRVDIKNLNTENKILIDWFSFTSKVHSAESIIEFLGLSELKFIDIYGCQGYKMRKYFDGINIHYGSERNEGVWVEMSGQGCRNFETYSSISFYELFNDVLSSRDDYHVTRLDVAYDDFEGIIPLKKLSKQILKGNFVSKFRSNNCTVTQSAGFSGITCDLGSCRSDVKFRVYDKAYERGYFDDIKNSGFTWNRWEVQMRNDHAMSFMEAVQTSDFNVGEVFCGVLLNYFRPCDFSRTDSNKRRWKISKWFAKFINNAKKVKLFTKCETEYNLYKCEDYVYRQCGNAIDTLLKIKGSKAFIRELRERKCETSLKYKELLNKYYYNKNLEDEKIFKEIVSTEKKFRNYKYKKKSGVVKW